MKRIVSILLVLVLILGLAACGGNGGETPADPTPGDATPAAPAPPTGDTVQITHWYWADTPEFSALMQEMVAEFNATNDQGIVVVAEEIPWDGGGYSETLFMTAMGGGAPDTAAWKLTSTPLFTANDLLLDLTPLVSAWGDRGLIDENLWNIMRESGGTDDIYVMPWNTQILYVYYRPSLFEAAGVEIPTTYDEFLAAIAALTGDGVYGFGMRGSTGGQEPWGSFIYARGGSFSDLTSPEAVAGMQDFIDVFQNGYAPPTAPADGFQEIIANFISGLTAMTIHHTGSAGRMVEALGDDVGAFAFPGGVGRWTSMGDTNNVIFADTEHPEAAFAWIAWLATGAGQETWNVATGNIPVSSEVQALPFFQDDRFMSASIDGVGFAGILPIRDTTTEWITSTWPHTVAAALLGELTAAEAMQILQDDLWR
ncbi:MAG: sugar ABC transporter substrate-binding protein [Oscillospiraceae bacterium]|nr:sugar ABC transporter substrate-binding protein [Oscillospiraceae bacterium]